MTRNTVVHCRTGLGLGLGSALCPAGITANADTAGRSGFVRPLAQTVGTFVSIPAGETGDVLNDSAALRPHLPGAKG